MQDFLNFLSAIFVVVGSLIIFQFGIPKQIDTGGKRSLVLMQEDEEEKRKIKKYKILGNIGILLITFSFVFQLLPNPLVKKFSVNTYHYSQRLIQWITIKHNK